jgi:uncharacterized lipoprotein YehR (DUF1307 family)
MLRTCLCIIFITLVLTGCGKKEAAKNPEQENAGQSVADTASVQDALIKEVQTIAKRDFRKTTWGMDKKTVKLTEPDDPKSEEDSAMIYSRNIAGMDVLIGYIFVQDKLVRAKYMFHPKHDDLNDYITDQNNIKKALEKRYGKAARERTIWSNDLYSKIPSQWGIALGQGYVTFLSLWDTPKTEITLTLKGENSKIDLWLECKSKSLAKLEQSGESAKTPGKK